MTDRAALLMDLADRVEKAEGADRAIDLDIARLRGVTVMRQRADDSGADEYTHWHYTASLDAALSLVPEGRDWHVQNNPSAGWSWATVRYADGIPAGWGAEMARAKHPALALCAAALRALASGAPR